MLVLRRRLAIAGVITATAIALPAAALASGPGSPSGKPSPPSASAPSASKSAPAPSASNSEAAPSQVKQAQPDLPPAPVGAFTMRLGVSTSAGGRAFKQIAGLSRTGSLDLASPAFAAIAHELGVSPAQLAAAWDAVNQGVPGN
jgi:hypothetical protein